VLDREHPAGAGEAALDLVDHQRGDRVRRDGVASGLAYVTGTDGQAASFDGSTNAVVTVSGLDEFPTTAMTLRCSASRPRASD
jgi:hypothetical protein